MTINPLSTPSTNTCCGKELAEDPEIEASSSATITLDHLLQSR